MTSSLCEWRGRGWGKGEGDLVSLPLLLRTPSPITLGPAHMTSFNLNYFLKGPVSKYSHGFAGLRHNICIWEGRGSIYSTGTG